jgi:hypothetical protein
MTPHAWKIEPAPGLALLLIYAKLHDWINWDWLWVTLPLWYPLPIIVGLILIGGTLWAAAKLLLLVIWVMERKKN